MATIESLTAGQLNKLKKDNPSVYRELMLGKSVNIQNSAGTTTSPKAANVPRFRNVAGAHELLTKWQEFTDNTLSDPTGTLEWLTKATTDQELQDFFVWVGELLSVASGAGLVNSLKRWKDFTPAQLKAMQATDPKRFDQLLSKERQRIRDKYLK